MASICAVDLEQVRSARSAGVLREITPDLLRFNQGVIPILCPDADKYKKRQHLEELVAYQAGAPRVHMLGVHGGAVALSRRSPLSNYSRFVFGFIRDIVRGRLCMLLYLLYPLLWFLGWCMRQDWRLLMDIWAASKLKGIRTVVLYIHLPCGVAQLCQQSFNVQLLHAARAKRRVKRWLRGSVDKALIFVHVDYGDKERTYVARAEDIERYAKGGFLLPSISLENIRVAV